MTKINIKRPGVAHFKKVLVKIPNSVISFVGAKLS